MHILVCFFCSCWDEAPDKRPSTDELVKKFANLSKVCYMCVYIHLCQLADLLCIVQYGNTVY